MSSMNRGDIPGVSRRYMLNLRKSHSYLALFASIITVFFSLYGIAGGIVEYAEKGDNIRGLFHWFTTNANSLTAFGACMIIPFAVEGVRKKHFTYPKWVAMVHYSGMVCTTLTMVFTLAIISWVDPKTAFGGSNLFLHIFCPILVFISFFLVEAGFRYTMKDAVIATIPVFVYEVIYLVEVVFVGRWEDLYHMTEILPFYVSMVLVCLLGLGVSLGIRWLYNKMSRVRMTRTLKAVWPKDVNPVEIKIEIFGLGRYMGKHTDSKFFEMPWELFTNISSYYNLKPEELIAPYFRGFLDSVKEKHG